MRRFGFMFAIFVIAMGMALPASAAPAATEKVNDFYTAGLDADGQFQLMFCSHAQSTTTATKASETYRCAFADGGWGTPALPTRAMRWDYDSTVGLHDDTFNIDGPYRWFSDVEDIVSGFDACWLYSNDWSMVITPSGNVNVTVKYAAPFVFEGPACS